MKKQELNRDIRRLYSQYKANSGKGDADLTKYFEWVEKTAKPELIRLYNADTSLKSLNANNLRLLIRLNLVYRAIPFHKFGLYID